MKMELIIKFDETEVGQVDDYLDGQSYRLIVESTLAFIRKRLKHVELNTIEEVTLELIEQHILDSLRDQLPGGVERLQ